MVCDFPRGQSSHPGIIGVEMRHTHIELNRVIHRRDICYICYAHRNWARYCDLDVPSNYLTVIDNMKKFNPEEKITLLKRSFFKAVKLLQANVESLTEQAELASKRADDESASGK